MKLLTQLGLRRRARPSPHHLVPHREADFVFHVRRSTRHWCWSGGWECPSYRTGVVQPGAVHQELPHKVTSKQGTIRAIYDYACKLDVEWDVQRPSSSGTSTARSVVSTSLRLFGVDMIPWAEILMNLDVQWWLISTVVNCDDIFCYDQNYGCNDFDETWLLCGTSKSVRALLRPNTYRSI
jgi:hypothetical protein